MNTDPTIVITDVEKLEGTPYPSFMLTKGSESLGEIPFGWFSYDPEALPNFNPYSLKGNSDKTLIDTFRIMVFDHLEGDWSDESAAKRAADSADPVKGKIIASAVMIGWDDDPKKTGGLLVFWTRNGAQTGGEVEPQIAPILLLDPSFYVGHHISKVKEVHQEHAVLCLSRWENLIKNIYVEAT